LCDTFLLGKTDKGAKQMFGPSTKLLTEDGIMRQPVFLQLREDKAAREVVREKPGEI
jgi:hypothetical protein